jgi:hypothetical protein
MNETALRRLKECCDQWKRHPDVRSPEANLLLDDIWRQIDALIDAGELEAALDDDYLPAGGDFWSDKYYDFCRRRHRVRDLLERFAFYGLSNPAVWWVVGILSILWLLYTGLLKDLLAQPARPGGAGG